MLASEIARPGIAEHGHTEGVIRAASEVFDGMGDTVNKEITLTETTGEGEDKKEKEVKVILTEAIRIVLNAVPESGRVDTTEQSEHEKPSKETNEMDEDIKKLSEPSSIRSLIKGAGHTAREGETAAA